MDAAALYDIIAPIVDERATVVRGAHPAFSDAEVADRALGQALARLNYDVPREVFLYLAARVERALAETQRLQAETTAGRARRAARYLERPVADRSRVSRDYHAADGATWSVREVDVADAPWTHGRHCLLFASDCAVRRVWDYPTRWQTLSDHDLEALSWRT